MSGEMAKIDEQITVVMREMARRRWAKTTPEERRQYAKFLVSTRRRTNNREPENGQTERVRPIRPPVPDIDQSGRDVGRAREAELGYSGIDVRGGAEAGAVYCFRCESGFHERCLDNNGYLACYCKRTLNHQSPGGEYR